MRLESGSKSAGLEHILHGNGTTPGHASDFAKAFGVSESKVPEYLHRAITNGTVISNTEKPIGNRMGFTRQYYYESNCYVVAGIGSNGYIVSAYPKLNVELGEMFDSYYCFDDDESGAFDEAKSGF